MKLELVWHSPMRLVDGRRDSLTYACSRFEEIPRRPGVYFFARSFGKVLIPLYIGRAKNLQARVAQHLYGNVLLMNSILHSKSGARWLVLGEWVSRPGQQQARALALIEAGIIKAALAEGHELFNDKGTKTPTHSLSMSGNRKAWQAIFRTRDVRLESR